MATKKLVPKLRSRWTINPIGYEYNTGEYIVKEGEATSVREILFRNTQGMTYDNYKTPFYEDQSTFSTTPMNQIQDMELTEKLQFLQETKQNASNLEEKIAAYKKQQDQLNSDARQRQATHSDAQQSTQEQSQTS